MNLLKVRIEMKKLVFLFILLSLSFTSYTQNDNFEKLCEKDFWRSIDKNFIDTITFFESHSVCIKKIPNSLYSLSKLKKLILSSAVSFEMISPEIINLAELNYLRVFKSKIKFLPNEICKLNKLTYLAIAWGGQLEELPKGIGELH